MKADFPATIIATVYNSLAVLRTIGEVLELEFSNDYNRCDGGKPGPHPHLICIGCKKIVDHEVEGLAGTTQKIAAASGYRLMDRGPEFHGLCPQCLKKRQCAFPRNTGEPYIKLKLKEFVMADKIEVCMCEKCGNEAEMTVSCQWIDVETPSGETRKKQKETRTCKVCGNEADLIIDFD